MTGGDRDLIITVASVSAMGYVLVSERMHDWRMCRRFRRALRRASRGRPSSG